MARVRGGGCRPRKGPPTVFKASKSWTWLSIPEDILEPTASRGLQSERGGRLLPSHHCPSRPGPGWSMTASGCLLTLLRGMSPGLIHTGCFHLKPGTPDNKTDQHGASVAKPKAAPTALSRPEVPASSVKHKASWHPRRGLREHPAGVAPCTTSITDHRACQTCRCQAPPQTYRIS